MELIKHECGIAMVRLLKPIEHYQQKYGTRLYGLNKLYLLMEKQHNRGQEAAGVGCVKMNVKPGNEYIFRERAEGADAIRDIFSKVHKAIDKARREQPEEEPFVGNVYMGHLRYSTTGRSGLSYVHPFLRRNNWSARNLLLCGNFNLTNVEEIFEDIIATGQHPRTYSDTFFLIEQLGHALDRENERLYKIHKENGLKGLDLSEAIARDINVANILHRCAPLWDGGYAICGIVGNGDMWVLRDPHGIRPVFYHIDGEKVVVASERPVIQTIFDLGAESVCELQPGEALIVDRDGTPRIEQILTPLAPAKCSFERIYFSRGSDEDIYNERKALGHELVKPIAEALDHDLENAVFSFIPNTAEAAFFGLTEGLDDYLIQHKISTLESLAKSGQLSAANIERILKQRIRREKVAIKDIKLRTFIAEGETRDDLAAHVYDITYGTIRKGTDTLVVIDDSIVRGTTLRQSIIRILDRLQPRKIIIVSSSPQVRYPDCYGIDMSRMGEFIAFRAAIQLLKERGLEDVTAHVYEQCKAQELMPKEEMRNCVKEIYAPFTDDEISAKIAEMLTPEGTNAEVQIVYQSLEGMHRAIPNHTGDWYFSGDYPTPGGIRLVNRAFVNFYEGNPDKR